MGNTDKFDSMADRYDTPERVRLAQLIAEAIRDVLSDAKSKSAIDFGCGTGLVGMNLLKDFKSVLFLDTSQNMLDRIRLKLPEAETLCFDFEQDRSADLRADVIFMAQVLLHIKDEAALLRRLYDVLNPEGHLVIVDFDKNDAVVSELVHNGFDQAALADVLSGIGYKNIRSRTFYHGSNLFMGRDASMFILDARK